MLCTGVRGNNYTRNAYALSLTLNCGITGNSIVSKQFIVIDRDKKCHYSMDLKK